MRLDWIASILIWVGNLILIQKKPWWVFGIFLIGNSIWTYYWWTKGETAAMLLVFSFAILNVWGLWKWRKMAT